jgi:serine/threonine protein phosphatase PrpC
MDQMLAAQPGSDMEDLHKESARIALGWADLMGVATDSVDATLLSAHVSGDRLIVACSGDGVIVLESHTGVLDVYEISSPSGYPFYPSYIHQPERLAELVDNDRSRKHVRHFRRTAASESFKLIEESTSESLTKVLNLEVSDYKYAAITSDGIHSFFHMQQSTNGKRVEAVPLTKILDVFWAFKNSQGAFVERRMKKFRKDAHAKGWQHGDDLSIGVIHLGANHVREASVFESQSVLDRG